MCEPIIKVNDLKKVYKVKEERDSVSGKIRDMFFPEYKKVLAVNDISFEINKGEIVGFIGMNGAGKSTTIKMLSGILYPDGGDVVCNGMNPNKDRIQYVSNIGAVFGQKSQLLWDLPLKDSFWLIKKIYKIEDNVYEENIKEFTELLSMGTFLNQPVRQLSLGQRMRGEITAALLHSPKLVFLDEPTIGLDIFAKKKIRDFIIKINRERKTTIIFTSHDMSDIELVCNRIIIMDKGEVIYDEPKEKLIKLFSASNSILVESETFDINTTIPDMQVEYVDDRWMRVTYPIEHNVSEVINQLSRYCKIRNILSEKVDIESIVRRIYEEKINDHIF